jgi:hypothetical protein
MPDQTPRVPLVALLEALARRVSLEGIRVAMPATVTRYLPAAQGATGPLPALVEVRLDQKYAREGHSDDAEDEEFKAREGTLDGSGELVGDYPAFTCPVHFPGPSTMWARGVIEVGEQGLVVWTDRDLGRWLVAGGEKTVDGWGHAHGENLSSAFFLPGVASGPQWPADVPLSGGKVGPRDGSSGLTMDAGGVVLDTTAAVSVEAVGNVTLDGALVKLGATAAQVVALLPELKAPLLALAAVYAALPGAVYATDFPAIKAGWEALQAAITAATGSAKGRG